MTAAREAAATCRCFLGCVGISLWRPPFQLAERARGEVRYKNRPPRRWLGFVVKNTPEFERRVLKAEAAPRRSRKIVLPALCLLEQQASHAFHPTTCVKLRREAPPLALGKRKKKSRGAFLSS